MRNLSSFVLVLGLSSSLMAWDNNRWDEYGNQIVPQKSFQEYDFENPGNTIERVLLLRKELQRNRAFANAIGAVRFQLEMNGNLNFSIVGMCAEQILDLVNNPLLGKMKEMQFSGCDFRQEEIIKKALVVSLSLNQQNQQQNNWNTSQCEHEITLKGIHPVIVTEILGYKPQGSSVFLTPNDPRYFPLKQLSENPGALYFPRGLFDNSRDFLEGILDEKLEPGSIMRFNKGDSRMVLLRSVIENYLNEKSKALSKPVVTNNNNNEAPKIPARVPAPQIQNNNNNAALKAQTLAEVGFDYKFQRGAYPTTVAFNNKNVDLFDSNSPTIYYFGSWDKNVVNARNGWQNPYFAFSNYYKNEAVLTSKSMPHTLYLEIGGQRYGFNNLEAAYQCAKTQASLQKQGGSLNAQQIKKFQDATPDQSKSLPATFGYKPGDNAALANIMYNLLAQKFINHPDLGNLLQSTRKSFLAEGNNWKDSIWGVSTQNGINFDTANSFSQLGFMLMTLRDQMAKGTAPKSAPDLKP